VYSDLGFILLGDLLERLVGERLDVQFARLAAQLGVEVGFRPLDRPLAVAADRCPITNRETADREPLRGVVHDDNARAMLGVAGHAGLFGTAAAVAAIGEALLDCYHDSGSRRQRSIGLTAATVRHFWALPTAPPGATFGLGWDHPTPALPGADAAAALSSAGRWWPRTGVGHLGFTGCSLWIDPPLRLCVVLLSNRVAVTTPEQAAQTQAGIRALRPALHDAVRCAYRL
jgi:CubicO group peptidase (beta-lactamase class C family)